MRYNAESVIYLESLLNKFILSGIFFYKFIKKIIKKDFSLLIEDNFFVNKIYIGY